MDGGNVLFIWFKFCKDLASYTLRDVDKKSLKEICQGLVRGSSGVRERKGSAHKSHSKRTHIAKLIPTL